MWVLKVWKKNREEWFLVKAKTLEDMADLREGAIRMGYLPNKKCRWEIQKKYDWHKKTQGKFGSKSRGKSDKSLQEMYPVIGSLTKKDRKSDEKAPKRFRQNAITQSVDWF
jgi:hypothetical protein